MRRSNHSARSIAETGTKPGLRVAHMRCRRTDSRGQLVPGTSRAISSRMASGSKGLSFGSRLLAASQTACRLLHPLALRAMAQIGRHSAFAKGNQCLHIGAHRVGQAHQNSKSGFTPARSAAFFTSCTSPNVLVTVPDFS